jgi:hypothetical protein
MKVRVCHHTLESGKFCQAVPLRGHIYCYHHYETMRRKMRMAVARFRVAMRLAEERHSGVTISLVKRAPKAVPAPRVNLMESNG